MSISDYADVPVLPLLSDYPWHYSRLSPDAEAMSLGERRWTYGALAAEIDELARALVAAGTLPGDRVAMLSPPTAAFVTVFMATAAIGAIWVGLNPKYRVDELLHVVRDCTPKLLFVRMSFDGRDYDTEVKALLQANPRMSVVPLDRLTSFLQHGRDVDGAQYAARRGAVNTRDPCLIVYTSGSTGRPKGALLHHHGLVTCARVQLASGTPRPLSMVNYFPINHLGCVGDVMALCIVAGGRLVFMERFDVEGCLALTARERVTLWGAVPSVFEMCLSSPQFPSFDLSAIELIFWGGAPLARNTFLKLREVCPLMGTNYGSTESTGAMTLMQAGEDEDVLLDSIGTASPLFEVRLAMDERVVMQPDVAAEIQARSDCLFLRYWERPAETAETFTHDGWFRTGDLGAWRTDGRLRFVGRSKEMFKSGGYNIYPREIERVLEEHPAVALAAVVGVSDAVWGEVGAAFVLLKESGNALSDELAVYCRGRLANFKVPKRITIVNELPLLPIGKVDKIALKRLAAAD